MASQKPSIASTGKFYSTPNTSFLEKIDRVANMQFNWSDNVATVEPDTTFNNNLTHQNIEDLWRIGAQSKVGKGSKTEEDLKARKSKEITADHITLNPELVKSLENYGQTMLKKLFCHVTPTLQDGYLQERGPLYMAYRL